MKAALLALGIMLGAPYQCATEPNERPTEDTAPQALWMLAERFASENNPSARETTLRQLIDRYPSSRYAERARHELGEAAPVVGAKEAGDDPEEGDE